MSILRSRLQEHFERIVREDLLTLFGCTASLRSLECSVLLQGAAQMSNEAKYRAACILEILTGQRATLQSCRVEEEDPQFKKKSGEEQRAMERLKSAIMHRANSNATAADFRALGNATVLRTTLRRTAMYDFLDKAREFYLPDVLLAKSAEFPSLASSSELKDSSGHFAAWNRSKLPHLSRFIAANPADLSANTAFVLRSSDLLKFPDIEVHFEALGSQIFSENVHSTDDSATLRIILRPTMTIKYPLGRKLHASSSLPKVNHFGVFNYLLFKFFNPYTTRPKLNILPQ
jgi:hypothetical protein